MIFFPSQLHPSCNISGVLQLRCEPLQGPVAWAFPPGFNKHPAFCMHVLHVRFGCCAVWSVNGIDWVFLVALNSFLLGLEKSFTGSMSHQKPGIYTACPRREMMDAPYSFNSPLFEDSSTFTCSSHTHFLKETGLRMTYLCG